ncbi:hypothetical protein SAMN06265219_103165 [Gracilimonas mengyeensis]|uniref:Uncharacterized protein n=1 Tax=Gracilimonas mengyeensis TaxID=1302730 RepID=A0A521BWL8_9BACT|nr:hypothetical protein SAMN06265219_103165 [Gracilimonas mengyeensis]
MRQVFITSLIILGLVKIYDILLNHLSAALLSGETLSYKIGFIAGVSLLFILAVKAYKWSQKVYTRYLSVSSEC